MKDLCLDFQRYTSQVYRLLASPNVGALKQSMNSNDLLRYYKGHTHQQLDQSASGILVCGIDLE